MASASGNSIDNPEYFKALLQKKNKGDSLTLRESGQLQNIETRTEKERVASEAAEENERVEKDKMAKRVSDEEKNKLQFVEQPIVNIATCNLNQMALDFTGNQRRIIESIKLAKEAGSGRKQASKPTLLSPCLLADWEGRSQCQSEPTCTEVERKSVGPQRGSDPNAPNTGSIGIPANN